MANYRSCRSLNQLGGILSHTLAYCWLILLSLSVTAQDPASRAQTAPKLLAAIPDQTLFLAPNTADRQGAVPSERIYVRDLSLSFGDLPSKSFSAYPYHKAIADAWVVNNYLIVLAKAPGFARVAVTASNNHGSMIDWFIVNVTDQSAAIQNNVTETAFESTLSQVPVSRIAEITVQLPTLDAKNVHYRIVPNLPPGLRFDGRDVSIRGRLDSVAPSDTFYWIGVSGRGEVAIQQFRVVERSTINAVARVNSEQSSSFELKVVSSLNSLSNAARSSTLPRTESSRRASVGIAASRPNFSSSENQTSIRQQFLVGVTNAMHARFREPARQPGNSDDAYTVWNYASTSFAQERGRNDRSVVDIEPRGIYVGFDTRVQDNWTTGLQIGFDGRSTSSVVGRSNLTSADASMPSFTSVMPYARWHNNDGSEIWGIVGVVRGNPTPLDGYSAMPDLEVRGLLLGAIGWRRLLGSSGNVRIATVGDAGLTVPLQLDALDNAAQALRAPATRSLRAGLEMSYAGEQLQPYVGFSGRVNNEAFLSNAGVEALGGIRYSSLGGLTVEAEGRALTSPWLTNAPEWLFSLAAHLDPGLQGEGFALSVSPVYGANSSGQSGYSTLFRQQLNDRSGVPTLDNSWAMRGTLSYGLPMAGSGVITPFGQLAISTLNQTRMGIRVSLNSNLDRLFNFEIASVQSRFEQKRFDQGVDVQLRLVF